MRDSELQGIRRDAERSIQEQQQEMYLFFSGRKRSLNLASVYRRYKTLYSKDSVEKVDRLCSMASDADRRRLQYLLEFLTINYRDLKIAELVDKLETGLSRAIIKISHRESVSYQGALIKTINEPSRDLRNKIQQECEKVVAGLNPLYRMIHEESWNVAEELGHKDYIAMMQYVSGIDLGALLKLAKDFLLETEAIYVSMLRGILDDEIGIASSQAKSHDLRYIGRFKSYDDFFPPGEMMNTVRRSMADMGLDMTANGHIRLFDTEAGERKDSRAFCVAVKVPQEIYIVTVPLGGVKNYGALLHELGHALQFGYTNRSLPFEYKRLGDASLSEGFASLLDHLVYNPDWLLEYLEMKATQKYLFTASFRQLHLLRSYMGEFLYEYELRRSPNTAGRDEIYAQIMYDACKVEFPKAMFLSAVDMDFFIARYIRAELFASLMEDYLESNLGKRWFKHKSAGKFLKEMWKDGQKLGVDQSAARLGYERLGFERWLSRITKYAT